MKRSSPTSRLLLALLLCVGCRDCSTPEPPDQYAIEAMTDPYDKVPARGKVTDEERAAEVIDLAAQQMHCGSSPNDVMKARSNDAWRKLLVSFLAIGDAPQIKAAWDMVSENLIHSDALPAETRVQIREAQARLWDYENAKMDADFMKRAYLAETVWSLYVVRALATTPPKKP
jgi:hypothetical protein